MIPKSISGAKQRVKCSDFQQKIEDFEVYLQPENL